MKKIFSLLVAGVLTFAMSVSSFAAFPDMPAGEAGAVLQRAVDNGLISGFDDGTVRPDTPITRAQMATIMSRAMNATDVAKRERSSTSGTTDATILIATTPSAIIADVPRRHTPTI